MSAPESALDVAERASSDTVRDVTTYVALLRAVNVGTANRIKMVDLKAAFVSAGHSDATTHIQTGNVIFTSSLQEAAVKDSAEQLITEHLRLTVTAIIRTADELKAVAAAHPLGGPADLKELYVCFLDSVPTTEAAAALSALSFADAELQIAGREIYLRYHAGAGTSKLTNSVIESKLKVKATSRNWNVTTNLAQLASQ